MKPLYNISLKYFMRSICLLGIIFFSNLSAQGGWTSISPPNAPDARQGHSMVTLPDGRVILFGGEYVEGTLFNDTYAIDINGWKKIVHTNTPPPIRKDHQAWTRADLMYVYGGYGENGALDDLWSYNYVTNTWNEEQISGVRPQARHGQATKTLTDGSDK